MALCLNIQAFNQKVRDLSDECPETRNFHHIVQLGSKKQYISCNKIHQYDRIISNISAIAPYAPKVSLIIHRASGNASFDYGGNISIPQSLIFPGKYGHTIYGNQFKISSIFAHEYGHAVFNEELKKREFFKVFNLYSRRISELRVKNLLAYTNGNIGNMINRTKDQMNDLSERRKQLDYIKMRDFITAYSELYADVVATYLVNQKSDIFEALYHDSLNDRQYEMLKARSFSNHGDWEDFYHTPHSLFAKTRAYIGKEYWPKTQAEKKKYLSVILKAIMAEIDKKYSEYSTFNAKRLNNDLIARLEEIRKTL